MNREDPIVDEIRATRERLLQEAGGFDNYIAKLKALEALEEAHVVSNVKTHRTTPKSVHCAEDETAYRK
jgi:F420-dependent methylenetetrahydromethanopterin dehydrogenase